MKDRISVNEMNVLVARKQAEMVADKTGDYSIRLIGKEKYIFGTGRMWTRKGCLE